MMEALRPDAVAARVVAWHNRHPLARRIVLAQVDSVAYVALPFIAPVTSRPSAPTSDAMPPAVGMRPAFDEDFIAPLKPGRVARWAARHGSCLPRPPADAPLREVERDAGAAGERTTPVYLLTAAIELGGRRVHVLVGAGECAAVLGPRLPSRPRQLVAALAVLALPLVVLGAGLLRAAPGASAPSPQAAIASAPLWSPIAASAPARVAAPRLGLVMPARSGLPISEADKAAARRARAALVAAGAIVERTVAALAGAASEIGAAPADKGSAQPAASAADSGIAVAEEGRISAAPPAFAVSTRPLRTHAEAEQVMAAMAALLSRPGSGGVRTEILPQGDDWRVASWPFARSDEAEKVRALLASRGMRVQVVAF